jgi:hypothetical protein
MKPSTRVFVTVAFSLVTVSLGETLFEADARAVSSVSISPGTLQSGVLIPTPLTVSFTPSLGTAELLILIPGFSITAPTASGGGPYSTGFCGDIQVGVTVSGPDTSSATCSAIQVAGMSQFFIDLGVPAIAGVPVTVVFSAGSLTAPGSGSWAIVTPRFVNGGSVVDTVNLTIVLTAPPVQAPVVIAPPAASPTLTPSPRPVAAAVPVPQVRQLAATGSNNLTGTLHFGVPTLFLAGLIFLMSRSRLRRGVDRVRHNSSCENVSQCTKPGLNDTTRSRRRS